MRQRNSSHRRVLHGNCEATTTRNALSPYFDICIHVADRDERRRHCVAYNTIFRKLFDFRPWESLTELQHALHRPTWEELVNKRKQKFRDRLSQ